MKRLIFIFILHYFYYKYYYFFVKYYLWKRVICFSFWWRMSLYSHRSQHGSR